MFGVDATRGALCIFCVCTQQFGVREIVFGPCIVWSSPFYFIRVLHYRQSVAVAIITVTVREWHAYNASIERYCVHTTEMIMRRRIIAEKKIGTGNDDTIIQNLVIVKYDAVI